MSRADEPLTATSAGPAVRAGPGARVHTSRLDLFTAFLRLGLTAFGGPAMVASIRELAGGAAPLAGRPRLRRRHCPVAGVARRHRHADGGLRRPGGAGPEWSGRRLGRLRPARFRAHASAVRGVWGWARVAAGPPDLRWTPARGGRAGGPRRLGYRPPTRPANRRRRAGGRRRRGAPPGRDPGAGHHRRGRRRRAPVRSAAVRNGRPARYPGSPFAAAGAAPRRDGRSRAGAPLRARQTPLSTGCDDGGD